MHKACYVDLTSDNIRREWFMHFELRIGRLARILVHMKIFHVSYQVLINMHENYFPKKFLDFELTQYFQ